MAHVGTHATLAFHGESVSHEAMHARDCQLQEIYVHSLARIRVHVSANTPQAVYTLSILIPLDIQHPERTQNLYAMTRRAPINSAAQSSLRNLSSGLIVCPTGDEHKYLQLPQTMPHRKCCSTGHPVMGHLPQKAAPNINVLG
jgi:hypothetical protein